VIVYTGRDLTLDDRDRLRGLAQTVIIKDVTTMNGCSTKPRFIYIVSRPTSPSASSASSAVSPRAIRGSAERSVLVVDDDLRNIFALTSLLEGYKMNVSYAENGKRALAKLEENPGIDVVLMDIMMPEMDGYEALRRIRERPEWKNLPVIALTAKGDEGRSREVHRGRRVGLHHQARGRRPADVAVARVDVPGVGLVAFERGQGPLEIRTRADLFLRVAGLRRARGA